MKKGKALSRLCGFCTAVMMAVGSFSQAAFAAQGSSEYTGNFVMIGAATPVTDAVRLANAVTFNSGGFWTEDKIDITGPLTISFDFWMGGGMTGDASAGNGADGISVSFTQTRPTGTPGQGEEQGFYGNGAFGVEYDTWYNANRNDPRHDHVAVIRDSVSNHLTLNAQYELDDSQWHSTSVIYRDRSITVILDGETVGQSAVDSLPDFSSAYLGISAATGGSTNVHLIRNVRINGGTVSGSTGTAALEDELLRKVRLYTSDGASTYKKTYLALMEAMAANNLPNEERLRLLNQFFVDQGAADPQEGIQYMQDASYAKMAYDYLTNNEAFLAYQYAYYLNNTTKGKITRGLLYADNWIFNNDTISQITDINTWLTGETKTIANYKAMLLDLMEGSADGFEGISYLQNVRKLADGMAGVYNNELEAQLKKLKESKIKKKPTSF